MLQLVKAYCDTRESEHPAEERIATQQLSVYQLGPPYVLLARVKCCEACMQQVLTEVKKRPGAVAVLWPLK